MVGIYKITNNKTKETYIGKSIDIKSRWASHIRRLNKNTHHSHKLQKAWNKEDDKSIFKFKVVKECNEKELTSMEIYYIYTYDSYRKGYNCADIDSTKAIKVKNKIDINKASYDEFMRLYNQLGDKLSIEGKTYLNRLVSQHYKYLEYRKVIRLITHVLNTYNIEEVKDMTLYYMLKKELFLRVLYHGTVFDFYIRKNQIGHYSRDEIKR